MLPEEAKAVAEHQRRRFNELVDVFDRPQPPEVMERLWEIVASAELRPGAVVLDVGTGAGVLIPLIQSYQPSTVLACDVAEKMLQRVQTSILESVLTTPTSSRWTWPRPAWTLSS